MGGLVELGRYSDAALAHIIRGRLESEGIPAFCFDTGMNAVESVPWFFQVRVMVLEDDLAEARAILADQTPAANARIEAQAEGYRTGKRQNRFMQYIALAFVALNLAWIAFIWFARPN